MTKDQQAERAKRMDVAHVVVAAGRVIKNKFGVPVFVLDAERQALNESYLRALVAAARKAAQTGPLAAMCDDIEKHLRETDQ